MRSCHRETRGLRVDSLFFNKELWHRWNHAIYILAASYTSDSLDICLKLVSSSSFFLHVSHIRLNKVGAFGTNITECSMWLNERICLDERDFQSLKNKCQNNQI